MQVGEETASIPDDVPLDELTVDRALEYLNTPGDRDLGTDPETGLPVVARSGRFGPYVSLGRLPERPSPGSPEARLMALPGSRREVKVAMAYLRLAAGRLTGEATRLVLTAPKRGVGKKALDRLEADVGSGSTPTRRSRSVVARPRR